MVVVCRLVCSMWLCVDCEKESLWYWAGRLLFDLFGGVAGDEPELAGIKSVFYIIGNVCMVLS